MDGVLVVDKPKGLTSHDVVAAARRVLRVRGIGHTGTLDPLATGVLPLAIGRATRLVRFMAASDKEYRATVRFGLTTDSYDITGTATGGTGQVPPRAAIDEAVRRLTGDYLQTPPAFSAKNVEGRRAYQLARQDQPVALAPAPVHVARASVVELDGPCAQITLTCSAGFYVRAFAHSLGELTGTGACLEALERTRSGDFTLEMALELTAVSNPARVAASLIPLNAVLPRFPARTVTDRGRAHVAHGRELMPEDLLALQDTPSVVDGDSRPATGDRPWVRLLDSEGSLVAMATAGRVQGSLHPTVVLI